MQKLREITHATVDLGVILMIGIAFVALLVVGFIIFKIKDQLVFGTNTASNYSYGNVSNNITNGFANAANLILIAITIFILAIAISALLMLRGGK
jgi:cell division protein FtsX